MEHELRRQMWAFVVAVASTVIAITVALTGAFAWALAAAGVAAGAWRAARVWSRARYGPMPHFLRWVLFLPRGFQTAARPENILLPRLGERILEAGPGVGIHALPIALVLAPDGVPEALETQQEMIDDLLRRATRADVRNIQATRVDAQRLPYPDDSFEQPSVWLPEEFLSHERFFEALVPPRWKPVVEELPAKTEQSRPRRSIGRASGMSGASGGAAP